MILAALMLLVASGCYASSAGKNFRSANRGNLFHPDKSADKELQSLITEYAPKFTLHTYSDDVTGLSIAYNVYVPEGYSADKKFPVVFFIADGSSAGKAPEYSLTKGLGGLIWCRHDCVVIVPAFPETVLDDHNGFVESEYVELAGRFVKWAVKNYPVDENRVYATGQSMGCMTSLILSAQNPGLFTACLFVSGQWDISVLQGLREQKFIYVASLGDDKASKGQQEVIDMFTNEGLPFVWYRNIDAQNPGITIPAGQPQSFITFTAGTTLPDGAGAEKYSEHMTSFDYAYRMQTAREWLLSQVKGD